MKIILFFYFCFAFCTGFAQNDDKKTQDFLKYAHKTEQKLTSAKNRKDYRKMEQLLSGILQAYNRIPMESQEKYSFAKTNIFYISCCVYSLSGQTEKAVENFRKAIENGYTNYKQAKNDPDLINIRQNPEFIELLVNVREKGDHIYLLQKTKYSTSTDSPIPFIYADTNDPALARTRKELELRKIAGNGDEISQILNLLKWVHVTVKHEDRESPDDKNAIDLIKTCQQENRGLNCRMLATILNECYLAMGFKSRFVTCLPKAEEDQECHVINSVYSQKLHKWLWIDPTFNAYVTDEKENLLSIAEVREKLIKGDSIRINEDANWNGQAESKQEYIDQYMAKNLYWFACPLKFKTDTETEGKEQPDYVSLLPEDFESSQKTSFITRNPNSFWQSPE